MKILITISSAYRPQIKIENNPFGWHVLEDNQLINQDSINFNYDLYERTLDDKPSFAVRIWNMRCPEYTSTRTIMHLIRKKCPDLKGHRMAPPNMHNRHWGAPVGTPGSKRHWTNGDDRCILCVKS